HNGMLNMAGEKMSKSRGNIKLVEELLAGFPGEAVRLALLQGHYRQQIFFTNDLLDQSVRSLDRLYTVIRTHGKI
ncbi:MAG: cysteine--tRNA ligase, partial [Pseudomonadota bacterium]|nr:cysteine--tRNA ligase [Pseudomonadota bacterium]